MSGIVALALLQAAGTAPATVSDQRQGRNVASVAAAFELREEELLLYALELDRLTLTETLTAYGDPSDPLLPVGELARLLDLDLTVSPSEQRITGTLGEERRALTLDLPTRLARVAGRAIPFDPDDAGVSRSDIYIRASTLERLFPVSFEVSAEALSIRLVATEKLPIQARMERLARLRGIGPNIDTGEPSLMIESPYRFFTPPSFDVAIESGRDTRTTPRFTGRYDIRAAGDLLFSGFQGYLGSDERGDPATARLLFERRSLAGDLPLGATRMSAGDVFTPALAMGPRSVAGRGFSFSTTPLEQASVFDTIDLRGELPIGHDVELYVNDVLRSGQRTPVQGRYEFLNVPLVRGLNVIRIVSYGPRGDRSEIVRVVNVGGGQLRKGETNIEAGLVQQDTALIELRPFSSRETDAIDIGAPRLVASVAHGLTESLTLVGGVSLYSTITDDNRQLVTGGLRTSLAGFAVQADAAGDQRGGVGLGLGLAGQPLGISTILRHAEYRGGFIDETVRVGDSRRTLARHSALTTDFSLPFFSGNRLPLSFRVLRDAFTDGGSIWTGSARTSATAAGMLLSTGLDYQRETRPDSDPDERLTGNLSALKFLNFKWQLRATADYDILPATRFRALAITADRNISDRLALRFGLGHSFATPKDTFAQTSAILRLPIGDLALTGDYSLRENDWRIGIRFAFGSLFDPGRRRYVMTPPGPASGGSAVLHSFIDRDGDGRYGPGDEPVAKVAITGGVRKQVTGNEGRAVVTGLGTAPRGQLQVDIADIDAFYVGAPPARVEFSPRPGQVLEIPYPLAPVGEVYARLTLVQPEGRVGLSAVRVQLVRHDREPIVATTEFDGSVVFSDVPLGSYRLEIDPQQAERLRMRLKEPVNITVRSDESVDVEADVEFEARPEVSTGQSTEIVAEEPDGGSQ